MRLPRGPPGAVPAGGCVGAWCAWTGSAGVHADNQNIYFLPAIVSTSTRMHGEFLRLLFLQAHRETEEAHFTAAGMSSQTNNPEALRFKGDAFYNGLKTHGPVAHQRL